LKCSWHLGMMMRIIETLLLKTQAYRLFSHKETPFTSNTPTNSPRSETPQPEVGYTYEAVLHRRATLADGALMGPSPQTHAHLATTFCRMLGCSAETSPACSQCCADFLRSVIYQSSSQRNIFVIPIAPQNLFRIRARRRLRCIRISLDPFA
jgi:hypothetical protein